MKEGAFALIDCLGFKGIWNRTDPTLVIEKLLNIEEIVSKEIVALKIPLNDKYGPVCVNVRLLSDTVAISLKFDDEILDEERKGLLITYMCYSVGQILSMFIEEEPVLVLRGCISFGQHISKGNFIVGPAVDDAAEYMNIAEGAFVWLLPNAAEIYENYIKYFISVKENISIDRIKQALLETDINNDVIDNFMLKLNDAYGCLFETLAKCFNIAIQSPIVIKSYYMPIKLGRKLRCSVINPLLVYNKNKFELNDIIDKYSRSISGKNIDIWLKQQNTIEYLNYVINVTRDFIDKQDKITDGLISNKVLFIQQLQNINASDKTITECESIIDNLANLKKTTKV
jgi:hypothetical protein